MLFSLGSPPNPRAYRAIFVRGCFWDFLVVIYIFFVKGTRNKTQKLLLFVYNASHSKYVNKSIYRLKEMYTKIFNDLAPHIHTCYYCVNFSCLSSNLHILNDKHVATILITRPCYEKKNIYPPLFTLINCVGENTATRVIFLCLIFKQAIETVNS